MLGLFPIRTFRCSRTQERHRSSAFNNPVQSVSTRIDSTFCSGLPVVDLRIWTHTNTASAPRQISETVASSFVVQMFSMRMGDGRSAFTPAAPLEALKVHVECQV